MTAAALTPQPRAHSAQPDTAADRALARMPINTPTLPSTLADLLGHSEPYTNELLRRLHRRGRVQRVRHYSGGVGQPAWAYVRPSP